MDQQDDLTYVEQVRNGDLGAFSHLVNKYKAGAYTLALRVVKNSEDAEEVSQDAFMKAYKSIDKFKQEAAFSTWLYRIVYNTALSRIRKKQLSSTTLDERFDAVDTNNTMNAFQQLVQSDQKRYIQYAIDKLSAEESTVITLYYINEKSMEEVSKITGLTSVNVRTKLFRGRKKLYGYLDKVLKKGRADLL